MQDFENIDTWGDEDGIEITNLDPQGEGFNALLPLSFLRKLHFPAHTRARLMTMAMLLGAIVLVLLIQPPSFSVPGQASSNHVLTTPSSQHFIVVSTVKVYTASEIILVNSSDGSVIVSQASDGTTVVRKNSCLLHVGSYEKRFWTAGSLLASPHKPTRVNSSPLLISRSGFGAIPMTMLMTLS